MSKFQETVTKYRSEQKANLREFGELLGVSYQTIKYWEDGVNVPSRYFLLALAMRHNDWRKDFALDAIQAIDPAYMDAIEMQKAVG